MIIFLNGPPRAGKDTAGNFLHEEYGFLHTKLSSELKDRCHAAHRLSVPHDFFEATKDVPRKEFEGLTPRQAYIAFSEKYAKPTFGVDIFGRWLLKNMIGGPNFAISDSGFREEALPIIAHFGQENAILLHIHRPGHDFSGDSRSYIELPVPTREVHNSGTIKDFYLKIEEAIPELKTRKTI